MHRSNIVLIVLFILLASFVFAHVVEEDYDVVDYSDRADHEIKDNSLLLLLIASVIVIIAVSFALYLNKFPKVFAKHKTMLFLSITVPVILASAYLIGGTIYLNNISTTQGPIHWHADFEIYNCGEKVELTQPEGLSNRIGTPVFHEHGDLRIHVEGVVVNYRDVSLGNFFSAIGGELTKESMTVPTASGKLFVNNGDKCNGKEGRLQVFLYKVANPDPAKKTGFVYRQEKLEEFTNYVLSPYAYVPPGDCIIIEFDEEKEKTDKICETYKIAIEKGDLTGS